jgi:hypothetical protein
MQIDEVIKSVELWELKVYHPLFYVVPISETLLPSLLHSILWFNYQLYSISLCYPDPDQALVYKNFSSMFFFLTLLYLYDILNLCQYLVRFL